MKVSNQSPRSNARHGQNLVEFAIVLPVLLLVLFGALDLGRIYFTTISLTSAAREGARYLTVNPDDVSNPSGTFLATQQIAVREAGYSGITITTADVSVTCTNSDDEPQYCDSGTAVLVTVTGEFELILGWVLPSPISISRSAQMMVP